MNMISTGAFQNEMDATIKQETLAEKFARVWEKKNTKAARAGGVSLMALSLAACGSDDEVVAVETPVVETPVVETPVVETPVVPVVTALVAGTDVTGTTGADSFSGTVAALTSGSTLVGTDDIAGGDGADSIAVSLGANFGGFTVTGSNTGSMSGIETVELSAADTIGRVFDATGVSGVTSYKIDGSNATITITDSADLAAIELSSIASGAWSITYTAATGGTSPVAGTADTLSLTAAGLGSATADISITAAGVETLAITSNAAPTAAGTTNYMNVSTVSNATSISITGAANTDLAAVSTATTSLDGSSSTGDITAALGNALGGALTSVKTGSGADTVTAAYDDLAANATINLGTGADTLALTGAATAVSQFVMSGIETMDVTSVTGGPTTLSMVKTDGATTTLVAGLSKTGANVNYAGDLDFVGDSGAKNIDFIGASTGTITTDSTGTMDIDVTANAAATALALNANSGRVEAALASSLDVSVTGNVNYTGVVQAGSATSAVITNAGGAQTGMQIAAAKAQTATITTDKGMVLAAASDLSGAQTVTIDSAGAFRDSSTTGFDAAAAMTLSGAGTLASATFDSLVGATGLAYSQSITASGLKAGLTFTGGVDAGSGSLTVDASGVTGAVDMSGMDAAGTITYTASDLGANTLGTMTGKSVVITATDSIGGISFSGGASDIVPGASVTIAGPTVSATDVDITTSAAATALTLNVTGGIAVDKYDVVTTATVKTVTITGNGGLSADQYSVDLANYTTDTTSTVTVNLDGIVADTTTQSVVSINITNEVTNALSITGSKGNNDTITLDNTFAATKAITLSGIEKMLIDDTTSMLASTLSGQAIDLTGVAGNEVVTVAGTAGADTINMSLLTIATTKDPLLSVDGNAGADTITVGALGVETIIHNDGDSGAYNTSSAKVASTVNFDVISGLNAGDKVNLTGAVDTHADYDTFKTIAAGADITSTVTTNEVLQMIGSYDSVTNTFTSDAVGDDLMLGFINTDTDTTIDECIILVGQTNVMADSEITNGIITIA